jgi:hypothetical protein
MSPLSHHLRTIAAVAVCAFGLHAGAPAGWFFAGSRPQEYDCNVDPASPYNGLPSTYIKSKEGVKTTGFGSMMQDFSATQYIGKRVRLSANLKSEGVTSWGGLWMRVDNSNQLRNGYPTSVAFDNMHDGLKDRSIKGTTAWQNYSVVLDVPEGATGIYIGALLDGPGAIWMNGVKVEVVGPDVPVTGRPMNQPPREGPTNLSLDK